MIIQKLNWDSEFFGISIGKLIVDNENDFEPVKFKEKVRSEKYELVYVFKYNKMLSSENVRTADLEFADIMVTMSKNFGKEKYIDLPYNFRTQLTEEELIDCYNIAEEISLLSRFYNEKKIGSAKTKKLYRKWIDNALDQSYCDGLFLAKENNKVIGIHLIKTHNDSGFCSLIGVNSSYKGKGIGKNLWAQAHGYWANEQDIKFCMVPFSFQNTESLNFHLKMGFNKVQEIKYIYHFRSN